MWEQRYGFPSPERAPSGYRLYRQEDVELLRRAVAFRARGLSVPAALERARTLGRDRPALDLRRGRVRRRAGHARRSCASAR